MVGLEPSCLLTLRDEYVDLLRTDAARAVARSSFLLEEFLLRERARGLTLPCEAGASAGRSSTGTATRRPWWARRPRWPRSRWAGYEVSEVDSGCCGMAGAFGFESEHYDISVSLGNRRLAPAVKAAAADTVVVAPGISCRQQIAHLTSGRRATPPRVLRDALLGPQRRQNADAEVQGEEPGGSARDEPGSR